MGGGDKPMRQIGGRTILERVIARLKPQCDGLILNANGDPARFAAFGLPVIADTVQDFPGPLAGILAALDWAAANRPEVAWVAERRGGLSVPAARSGRAPASGARRAERAARGRGLRRAVASGDRIVERGVARGTSPRAGGGGRQQDRPLDRALQTRHRDMADDAARSRSSTPTPWMTSPKPSGWRRWTGIRPPADKPAQFSANSSKISRIQSITTRADGLRLR